MESANSPSAQILIVEDEKIIAKDLEIRLKRMNYQVVGAVTNSADCLALLETREGKVDLILMDIMIDGPKDGIETAHEVRGRYDIPIIFLTAYADESTFQRAKLSDPFGYILKPFQERELDLSIQTVLQKHRLERQIRDNEARYRLLFESTQEAILVLDDEARLVDGNAATEHLFGRASHELEGRSLYELSGFGERERFEQAWARHMADGQGRGRYKLRRPDGSVRYVDYSIRLDYMPHRHLAVLRDVTKQLEDQREIEALARIPAEAPSPILRVSPEGQLIYANRQAESLLAAWQGPGGVLALPPQVRHLMQDLSPLEPQASVVVQAAGRYYQLLAAYVAKAGYVNIYATDITDQHFSEALVGFQRDVLEQVAKGQTLRETLSRLAEGLEAIMPDMAALLVWKDSAQERYQCVGGTTIDESDLLAFCLNLNDAQGDTPLALAEGLPLYQLKESLEGSQPGCALQGTIYTLPDYTRSEATASLVVFWQDGRPLSGRENSVCKLALRLSATAFERDATYQRLRQQSLAFENINDAIILTDAEGVVTDWSPSAERIFHISKEEMVGRRLDEAQLFGPDLSASPAAQRVPGNAALTDRQQAVFTRPDGASGWAELSQVDMLDPTGNLLGRLQVARDITQKKQVEQQLNIAEHHLKAIFDNSVQSFVLLDLAYKVVAFNRQAERWVNDYARRRLRKGVSISQFWPTGHSLNLKQGLRQAAGGEVSTFEDFLITKEAYGSPIEVYLEISLMPVRDASGQITGICLTALDIAERKSNERNLARSEARFRSLVQNSSDLVLLLDEEGTLDYASESSLRITGYSPEQLQNTRITRYVHERDKVRLLEALRKSIDGEEPSTQLEYRFIKADGQTLTLEAVITNELENEYIHALVINSRDVTERKLAEDALSNIVEGVSDFTGEDFFVSLTDNLAVYLGIPNVLFAELDSSNELSALAMVQEGSPAQPRNLGKMGPFSEDVMHAGFLYVSNLASSHYATDPLFSRFKASFAMGVALRASSDGRPLGLLVAAGTDEADTLAKADKMLKVFSVRAGMELERNYSTRALQESEANLTALVENTSDAIWSLDSAYLVTALNSSFRERFAHLFTTGIEIGSSVLERMSGDEREQWQPFYDRALGGERHTQEIAVSSARHHFEYEVGFNPIVSASGAVTGVSVFARDITERKKAELALRQSEMNLSALIENTDDIIYSLDRQFRLVTANTSFNRALYEAGTAAHPRDLQDIGNVAFGQAWGELYEKAMRGEKFREELPVTMGGEPRAIEASFNPILTKDRAVEGVSVMARDITERKRAEDELKRTNFELDSFVYRASHDLRAPLRSVLGLVNLLKIEKDPAESAKFLALAEKSINKLDTFISDLTHFSRNSRQEIISNQIDFNAQIAECLENLRYMEKAGRVEPRVELNQEGPFYSDPQRIAIILQNLVSNAIKYQRDNVESYVRIAIRSTDASCTLTIEDNGKGIQDEYLSRIFEMFFRASEDSYGSGLGLYITAQVIEKLGGKMRVESVYGQGTRFELTIPNHIPHEQEVEAAY